MKPLFIIITTLLLVNSGFAGIEKMTLLTQEEGAMEDIPPGLYEAGRILNDGPEIKVIAPEKNNEYTSPLIISILFIPDNNSNIDLSKLKVECLKLITIDLTKRVLPYTTEKGINIEKAELPRGVYKIRVTIGDLKGGLTQEVFEVKVL